MQEQEFDTSVDIDSMPLWCTHKRLCMTHTTDEATRNLETPTGIEYSSPRQCCNPTKPVRTDGATCHYFRLCADMTTAPSQCTSIHVAIRVASCAHRRTLSQRYERSVYMRVPHCPIHKSADKAQGDRKADHLKASQIRTKNADSHLQQTSGRRGGPGSTRSPRTARAPR